jgi:hypothetical protein
MKELQFWNLHRPESMVSEADYRDGADWEGVTCPVDDEHQRAGRRITDLDVEVRSGVKADFLWTFLSDCLIQDRVLELLRKNEVTGFEVKPVTTHFKRQCSDKPPRLWEFIVIGWAGIAPADSGIRLDESCGACGLLEYSGCSDPSKLIDARQWDGSDIFMVWPLPRYIFVTDRVAQLVRDNRLRGCVLKRPSELDVSRGFSPGRLNCWMPDARARELGEPLGIY